MAGAYRLPKGIRLRSRQDIRAVFHKGEYHALGVLHAKTLRTKGESIRFAISVKKGIGNAPARNRIKRLVREAVRRHHHSLSLSHDICFFVPAKPREPVSLASIEREFHKLAGRLSQNP